MLTLAAEGTAVAVADIAEGGARVMAEQIEAVAGRAHAVRVDFAHPTLVQAMIDTCVADFGRLDFLISNAATTQLASTCIPASPTWTSQQGKDVGGQPH